MKKAAGKRRRGATASVTIGRRGFAQISAVEGIRLTDEMWSDFRDFDHKRLSSLERRKTIVRKYGSTR